MKIVIYEMRPRSLFSIICSLVTLSSYSHGAIYNNGILYDATFKRGYFWIADSIEKNRMVAVVDIDGNCEQWIMKNLYRRYDILGLLLWPFGISNVNRFYCFEAVESALSSVGIFLDLGMRKDGKTILTRLVDRGCTVELMTGQKFNENYLK